MSCRIEKNRIVYEGAVTAEDHGTHRRVLLEENLRQTERDELAWDLADLIAEELAGIAGFDRDRSYPCLRITVERVS